MSLFNFFRKKRRVRNKQSGRKARLSSGKKQAIEKIGADFERFQVQLNTVNIVLKKHDDELAEHRELISQHSEGLEKLEQKVNTVHINSLVKETIPTARPTEIINPSTIAAPATSDSTQKFDINHFSEQQKRILAAFFQNQGMALSYVDIGKILNKSPHTVKNQMREIRLKADLFETSIGEQSRHRFKFKNDLRIEKYLNVG